MDVGAGDARAAHRRARSQPERLFIAVDADPDAMRAVAAKVGRKPSKGGVGNLVLVHADLREIGTALCGVADEVTVTLPWAGLLAAAAGFDVAGLAQLRALCRAGAAFQAVVSYDAARDSAVPEVSGLDAAWMGGSIHARYGACGFTDVTTRALTMDELRAIPTRWAKRLGFGPTRPAWRIDAVSAHR